MSKWKTAMLVLVLGIGIGGIVPAATMWWENRDYRPVFSEGMNENATYYHFGLDHGVLSIIDGKPGEPGQILVTGLQVASWPKDILEMAPKVEFHSLDEVQSFIDSVGEMLLQE